MNPDLSLLYPYPFEKLAELKRGLTPPANLSHIALSIGEPQHAAPQFVVDKLIENIHQLSNYPSTKGKVELRQTIASWVSNRFNIDSTLVDPEKHVLPVTGTREALFAIAQCLIDRTAKNPLVLMPNPFYQIYEGAAILAGAKPHYLNCIEANGYLPDLDAITTQQWQDCQLMYICTPGNPTGAVMSQAYLQQLISLSQKHDFVIVSDECYSEIYFDENQPPPGLLEAAANMGLTDFDRCLIFHSLSKRSNLPGLRSGFVAGDAKIIAKFLLYRTYHGSAMPPVTQSASIAAWSDERHVVENRNLYREKFDSVLSILSNTPSSTLQPTRPQAGFYLWVTTPIPDTHFAVRLYAEQNITVLPGSLLSRDTNEDNANKNLGNNPTKNPGMNKIRLALVAPLEECQDAANRINTLISHL
jgi:N-succinyldiaminopimelate aminotransferase